MTTSYTSLLGLALPVTGELAGTWGDTVNNSITSLLDSAVAGTTTLSTDADVTLTTTTGAANQARAAVLLCTGARAALRNITAPAQSKVYVVINSTTGGYGVKIRGVGPTTGVTVANGKTAVVAWNGSDFVEVAPATATTATNIAGGATGSVPYQSAASTTAMLSLGTAAQVLQVNSGATAPEWVSSTGTGNVVRASSPTLTTPTLGVASATSINKVAFTAPATGSTLTIADGKTLTANNSLTLAGTDSTTMTFPTTNASIARTDAAQTFTGTQTFSSNPVLSGGTANGVVYLNGSKVAASGTALAFDGTNLSVGAAWTTNPMRSTQPQYFQYASGNNALTVASDTAALLQALRFSTNASGATLSFGKARGTYASPTAVASGDVIASINWQAYGGTNARTIAQIGGVVDTYTSDTDISSLLVFSTSSSGAATATERMRLDSSGNLGIGRTPTYQLDVNSTARFNSTIGVGNTAPAASGAGISFPATQSASSDANTLDDYEEGTWTPTAGAGLTYTGGLTTRGTYTKIGNAVILTGELLATTLSCSAGTILCGSLPFTPSPPTAGYCSGTVVDQGALSVGNCAVLNATNVYQGTTFTSVGSGIHFTISYQTST